MNVRLGIDRGAGERERCLSQDNPAVCTLRVPDLTDWFICNFSFFGTTFGEVFYQVFKLFFGQFSVNSPYEISSKHPLQPLKKVLDPPMNPVKGQTNQSDLIMAEARRQAGMHVRRCLTETKDVKRHDPVNLLLLSSDWFT